MRPVIFLLASLAFAQQQPASRGKFSIGDLFGDRSSATLKIVSARYGAENKFADVRQLLESQIKDGRL